jgi:hypothetical protein
MLYGFNMVEICLIVKNQKFNLASECICSLPYWGHPYGDANGCTRSVTTMVKHSGPFHQPSSLSQTVESHVTLRTFQSHVATSHLLRHPENVRDKHTLCFHRSYARKTITLSDTTVTVSYEIEGIETSVELKK